MEIQAVSGTALTIYLNSDDLKERNLRPDSVTKRDAEALLKYAADTVGCGNVKKVYIELFPGKEEMLLFVRLSACAPLFFAFSNIEDVIAAALNVHDVMPSSLTYIDGVYILTVYPWERDMSDAVLAEYGERLAMKPEFELYLFEHGKILMRTEAIGRLNQLFTPENARKLQVRP